MVRRPSLFRIPTCLGAALVSALDGSLGRDLGHFVFAGTSTLVSCRTKSRCALSRSAATSKVYLVAASTPGRVGRPGILGRSMTGSTDTALTQLFAASMDSCWPCWRLETSCSRDFWASAGISVRVSFAGLVLDVAIVDSLKSLEGARRRRHSINVSSEC